MKTRLLNLLSLVIANTVLVFIDQYTKMLAVSYLKNNNPFVILEGVFELLYSENRGAAFGMLQGRQSFFFLISIVVVGGAVFAMWCMPGWANKRYHWLKFCTIMIASGAIGNMIDRVSQGYVVDFLYFKLIDFPIFNVADIYVTTATFILLLVLCFYYKDEDLSVFQIKKGESC